MRLVPLMLTMSSSSAASTVNNHATMLGSGPFEEVEKVKYLGSMFVAYNQGIKETRSTINLSGLSAFSHLQSCPCFRCVQRAVVRSIRLHDCETWPVRVVDEVMVVFFDNICRIIQGGRTEIAYQL